MNLTYFKKIIEKLSNSLFKSSTGNGDMLEEETVCNDLTLLTSYLNGHDTYTSNIGHLLSCIVENTLPHHWLKKQHIDNRVEECFNLLNYC